MNAVGAFGYGATGALYVVLTVLLIATWRGNRFGIYLILASFISAVWGIFLAGGLIFGTADPLFLALAEIARAASWILFLVLLVSQIDASRLLRILSLSTCLAVIAAVFFVFIRGVKDPGATVNLGGVLIPGGLAMAVFGLMLIEQLYRNSTSQARWSLKPLVLGVGGLFAYDLFLYSQGLMLGGIDATTWTARGVVNLLFVPIIAIAARRNRNWEMRIFVSRHVVFYSTTMTAVGLYLLLMSLGGYLIVRFGGSWGGLAQIVFFAGAMVVLFTLLFSSTLRARLRVFLNKHFFHNKYDYRDEWLRLVATLAEFNNNEGRHVAVKALAQIVESPSGALWIRDEENLVFRIYARFETEDELSEIPLDDPVIRFIEKRSWVIDFQEYSQNPDMYQDMQLPNWLDRRSACWLLVPLQASGILVGLIMLDKSPGPPRLNYEDRDLLKTVGNHIAVQLAQAKSDSLLAEAQQFEAYNRLTAFLMHDLNNLIAQQSLIVDNAEKHKRNPEFVDDAITTIAGSVERMKRVMRQLRSGGSDSQAKPIELRFAASAAVDRCSDRRPVPKISVNGVDARINAKVDDFIMVLSHLLRNAQDACAKDGEVELSLRVADGMALINITDNGAGMSREFMRNRLFRPFDSTKGSQGMGIGAYQAREFVRGLGGDLTVSSEISEGTEVSITLPLAEDT